MPDFLSKLARFVSRCAYLLLGLAMAVVYVGVTGLLVVWLLFQPSAMDKSLLVDEFDPPADGPRTLPQATALPG